ncbi:hypothetical protein, partial [Streptomyces laurentii]|uniref:hypothetical protein n=1 Tax=Streptomyces laurentii TaxID=39478 RepID=UPI0033E36961
MANPKSTIKAVGVRVEPDPTNPAPLKDAIYCSLNGTYNSMVQRQAGEESRLGQLVGLGQVRVGVACPAGLVCRWGRVTPEEMSAV